MKKGYYSRGFTLIELLLIIALLLILTTASVPVYGNLQISGQRQEAVTRTVSGLRLAKAYSRARKDNDAHGVYFEINPGDDRMIIYKGSSYSARDDVYDQEFIFGGSIKISTTYSDNDINFSKGIGGVEAGNVLIENEFMSKVVEINDLGLIKQKYE